MFGLASGRSPHTIFASKGDTHPCPTAEDTYRMVTQMRTVVIRLVAGGITCFLSFIVYSNYLQSSDVSVSPHQYKYSIINSIPIPIYFAEFAAPNLAFITRALLKVHEFMPHVCYTVVGW